MSAPWSRRSLPSASGVQASRSGREQRLALVVAAAGHGRDQERQEARSPRRDAVGAQVHRRRVLARRIAQHDLQPLAGMAVPQPGDDAAPWRRQLDRAHREELVGASGVTEPEERRHLLEGPLARQRADVDAAVVERAVADQRDRRLEHRQPPRQRLARHRRRIATAGAPQPQRLDVVAGVEARPRVVARLRVEQPAAHVGVESRRFDAELARRLGGGEERAGGRARVRSSSRHVLNACSNSDGGRRRQLVARGATY